MAEVALPALPAAAATAATLSITSAVSTGVIGTAAGQPFANLLTALADPSTVATAPSVLAPTLPGGKAATGLPTVIASLATAMPGAGSSDATPLTATPDTDTDTDKATADPAPTTPIATLPADLTALLAFIIPPRQPVAAPFRAPAPAEASAPASLASTTAPSPSVVAASIERPVTADDMRLKRAFAEVRAPLEPSPAEPAPPEAAPSPTSPAVAAKVASVVVLPMPDSAKASPPTVSRPGEVSVATRPPAQATPPAATTAPDPATIAPPMRPSTAAPAVDAPVAASPALDVPIAQPSAETPTTPRGSAPAVTLPVRAALPATVEPRVVTPPVAETQRPATPQRPRKSAEAARIADVRLDAPAPRITLSTSGTAPQRADDPVARQLSIAQDGQWLDALTRDIAGAGNADGQLRFRLDPDHLGSLTVQIAQGSDGASIRLTASTEAARTILADAQPRLVAEARAQGLSLREATVETRSATPAAATPAPTASSSGGFTGGGASGRGDQGGVAAQLQQQSQQQSGGRQRAPDAPRQANPAPRAPTSTRSGADLYA